MAGRVLCADGDARTASVLRESLLEQGYDVESAHDGAAALDRLAGGRTMVSIAHRLSTAERADLVVVFDAGEIVQVGSHDELVAQPGIYATLYESWIGNTRSDSSAA